MLNELFILSKIKEGDIKAFEEVFHRYYSPLCWYATGITGEMEAAEEIVEELFYVFWKDREHLQIFQSVKRTGDALEITFDTCDEQLVARNKYGYLSGFAIAGTDGKYQWAQAKIENNKVIVWNKKIQQPVSVRYAWGDNPDDANLYNAAGLPASPFEGHINQ